MNYISVRSIPAGYKTVKFDIQSFNPIWTRYHRAYAQHGMLDTRYTWSFHRVAVF